MEVIRSFSQKKNKYNEMENISKLVYMAVEKCGEWEREYSTKMFGALYQ